ncbi:TlrC/CarA/OleB/SrmB family ABC-F type ribosomal protection protein [Streptomyces sp. PSKA54]|uniref:TlrC/CarA/OleB/SrmB family ABC-F type ribosomal protection protein n=1 Tax=Streptomyces himalayensis subsp. aureolus TaxID=2758039 RepID=A0A7W2HI44_9ACTN|nr:TlrC/CarA/OleB/SrmB family ABC-F type ribosomal protection protein [Streptomyces himalayensis]MBA4864703.1 TlrC/CarA/OleB/SrmB family ABC-F type ribosomal protection protein [Streptomyces himalayensis subsp. aureolus]
MRASHSSPSVCSSQLSLHGVTKRYGDRTVLDQISFSLAPGEKAGVVGDNGAGKSTLLRLLAGEERPDAGEMTVAAPGGTGYLAQTLSLPAQATVQDAVDLALAELRAIEAALRRAEAALAEAPAGEGLQDALAAYAQVTEQYEARDGYGADARVDAALHGLGLPGLDRGRRLGTLSGGERSRLALAATLASRPELLLLDEPTNDLDDRAVGWLEEHLRAHRGTIVAVTHDRVFLERITTTVLEVDGGCVSRHGNGYAGYLSAKAAERRRRQQQYDQWRAELDRSRRLAEAGVARLDGIPRKMPKACFGHGGFRMRGRAHGAMGRIRNAKERVERLTTNPVAPPPQALSFTARIATAGRPGTAPAAQLDGVVVDGRLHVPQLRLDAAERLLVTGANGAGKSTLLRVLAGELRPDAGAVSVPGRVGHLRQEEWPWPPGLTVLEAFAHSRGGDRDEHADRLLSLGLFDPEALRLRVGELSYGQRRRIELARLVSEPVDLLLLDEPTNHLSPALVEQLEEALADYAGALVIVTHDRRMRTRFTGSRLELREGAVAVGH